MATPQKFAIRDAGEWSFFDLQTGKPITTLNTIRTVSIDFTSETVYSRGGFGSPKLVGFSGNKEGKLSIEDALYSPEAISMLTGNKVGKGAKVIAINEKTKITSNKATIKNTPKGAITSVVLVMQDGSSGEEFTLGAPATNKKEFSITGKELTFHADVANDTVVRVYYNVTTGTDTKTVRISSDAFGGTFKAVGRVLVRDAFDGKDYPAIITVPRAKFEDNFNMSLSVDGDPAVLTMPVEMLKDPLTDDLFTMTIFNEDEIV